MFTPSAQFYDILYSWKDYASESALVRGFIEQYKRAPGTTLLDVACGTGKHAQYLAEHYTVEGLDLDGELLKVARERLPGVPFYQADMVNFDLGRQYDAITCLFSSIGYTRTEERMNQTLRTFARHLLPGGVVLVEPWLMPGQLIPRHVSARFVDEPELKIARMNSMRIEDGISYLDFHYLVGTPDGVTHFTEEHALAVFTDAQYRAAFTGAGLETSFETPGLDGRGMYIGVKP
jgi:ubiquinone/menaquinone biosynthesis C-methylase UbiE